jgi:hypothetical protein
MTKKQSRNDKLIIRKSSIPNIKIWLILTLMGLGGYFIYPIFNLNENQILYLFSAASQVIAAIFGLIITGYIFLRNELDRKADKDESYEEIISILKADYFYSIKTISFVTLISISLCFLVIINESDSNNIISDILINITVPIILTELILIVSFVINILNPNSLEIASDKLKSETTLNENGEKGSIEVFLTNYNQTEYILQKYGTAISNPELTDYESVKKKRISNSKLVNILFNDGRIDFKLKEDLINLISFRNSLIHGSNLFISKEDEELSNEILNKLKESLSVG